MNKCYEFRNVAENEVDLFIRGEIMDDESKSFMRALFGDDSGTSPTEFSEELKKHAGKNINLYIDSYGGDVFAASSIYTSLKEHNGNITVKITGIAASAASVIAMAGDKVLMSKTAVMMIHNPMTYASGDHNDMKKAAEVLDVIKESIINAYESKTRLSREKISDLMEKETWMDSSAAVENGFCDGIIDEEADYAKVVKNCLENRMFVYNSIAKKPMVVGLDLAKHDGGGGVDNYVDLRAEEQMDRYIRLITQ